VLWLRSCAETKALFGGKFSKKSLLLPVEVWDRNIKVALDEAWMETTACESMGKTPHWDTGYQPHGDTQQGEGPVKKEFVKPLDTLDRKVGFSGAVSLSPNTPSSFLAGEGNEGLSDLPGI